MTANAPRNMIFNADCIDVMQAFDTGSVDFVLTDPPYVTAYRDRQGRTVRNDDNARWLKPAFAEMYRVLKDGGFAISFYGWHKVDLFMAAWKAAGFRVVGHIVFRKTYASSARFLRYEHEQAYLLAKGDPTLPARPIPDVIDMPYSGNRLHPTQKPVEALMRVGTFAVPSARLSDRLTHVELTHIEKRVENWIRFGRYVGERIVDRRRRVLSFRPGSVFAFVRWAANDYGTVASRIDIVRAVEPGEPYQTLPFVRPGGDILLHVDGWPKVERVLRHIDTVEAAGIDPCDAAPDHWRHVHNRIATGEEPRAYTAERHRAWLKRREIER